nr:flavonoid 3'-monooxygenase-like [Ipomoea batatas]
MENISCWVFQALPWLLALVFLFKINTFYQRRKSKTPPGPRPWPIIGNLNLLGSLPHHSLHLLSQKYGELMLLKFGSKPVLVASSPETAKLFLKTHDAVFASRPPTAAGDHTFNRADLMWSPYGSPWRHGRKILLSEVFTPKKLESFEYVRVEERTALISRIYDAVGTKKPVLLRDHLLRFTLSTMTRLVSGHKYYDSNDCSEMRKPNGYTITLEKLQGILDEWFLLSGVINLGDWVPWLSGFDLQGYVKKMKALRDEYEEFLNYVIEDHRAVMKAEKNFVPKDMVDIFLQIADDPNLEPDVELNRDRIMGLIHNMLAGGTDTAAALVEWAFQELLRKPLIIEKATEELDRVIGRDRWVEERDFYATSIYGSNHQGNIQVASTLHIAPTSLFHGRLQCGRNPKYWDNADEFFPERFLKRDLDINGQDFALLPFGSGRRRCPGYSLGMKVVRTTLANLLHGFNWKLVGDMNPEDISLEEVYGLTTHPKFSLSFNIDPRLPTHLY